MNCKHNRYTLDCDPRCYSSVIQHQDACMKVVFNLSQVLDKESI